MNLKQLVSVGIWGVVALFMLPALASTASAGEPEAIPLEGSQCWARCSTCTTRCASVHGADRAQCERTCQAGNDQCCEGNGRHGTSRACGCY
jgi:hypothetical protein